ncbi:type I-E CRISPR-associated protein Cas7/Cse4/CasC [Roseospira goensis]|uniref:CRISPR system Cascade subunit CasC n=1 Tax=Roseospira goensis TaxID=391922 RepID=A0A7W6RZB0_9PROT|nr:type I-E CRISPR-associated protein Cas7/Cse4/CasC [Roseospira goensis]MBB4285983.1 CRISPR system Cascade subunit CasC [Roseospira goensis]
MSTYVQIHALTFYPAANLSSDHTGRPARMMMGGVPRLRISSQCLTRAWRTSPTFAETLAGHLEERRERLGEEVHAYLTAKNMAEDRAHEVTRAIVNVFGRMEAGDNGTAPSVRRLSSISSQETAGAFALADRALAGETIDASAASALRRTDVAADMAVFGRMKEDDPAYTREPAAQVAHAVTTHRALVERDLTSAPEEPDAPDAPPGDAAAHPQVLPETAFGAGVYYLYVCLNRDQLRDNLKGHDGIAQAASAALVRAVATVAPRGHIASFAHHALAGFVLVERGPAPPRGLSLAFLRPVPPGNYLAQSVRALATTRDALSAAYNDTPDALALDITGTWRGRKGCLDELAAFAAG